MSTHYKGEDRDFLCEPDPTCEACAVKLYENERTLCATCDAERELEDRRLREAAPALYRACKAICTAKQPNPEEVAKAITQKWASDVEYGLSTLRALIAAAIYARDRANAIDTARAALKLADEGEEGGV